METVASRWIKVLHGQKPADRLPTLEWAWWWNLTIQRWEAEGLPKAMHEAQTKEYFGLDCDYHLTFGQFAPGGPPRPAYGQPWIRNEADYEKLLPYLYPDPVPFNRQEWAGYAARQARGEAVVWFNLQGFFWWPRELFGIEGHLYAFYDQPKLMQRINADQLKYQKRCVEQLCTVARPVMMNFWEDLSYNHGPMLSQEQFNEFLAPYYREIVPFLETREIVPLIDSDGQIEPMIPWFKAVGLRGIGPLERMAGVDVNRIRGAYPDWFMMGGFDKTTMPHGVAAMRAEFERILPAMKAGRYVPSVDHQTPPGVSLDLYRQYRLLQDEFARKAVDG